MAATAAILIVRRHCILSAIGIDGLALGEIFVCEEQVGDAKIVSEGKDPGRIQIEATIDASSIDTRAPKRDKHLKSADFFDVEHYPTIVFKSKKAEPVRSMRRYCLVDE